jgi:C4-dicarboxylate-specific signal transduction histidine kinase
MDDLKAMVAGMRQTAQVGFREGVDGIISEIRRFAVAAEGAIGEISIDEALEGVARVVTDRVAQLTGKTP